MDKEEIKIKEFDKEQLELLLKDLQDIDKFTGFKDGAFKYELGKYQANLLVNCIKKQKEVIDKAIKLIKYNERYRDGADCCQFVDIVSEILDPLQSILEKDETTNNAYLKEFEDWLKEVSE